MDETIFPLEIWLLIFKSSCTNFKELFQIVGTCSYFRSIVLNNPELWIDLPLPEVKAQYFIDLLSANQIPKYLTAHHLNGVRLQNQTILLSGDIARSVLISCLISNLHKVTDSIINGCIIESTSNVGLSNSVISNCKFSEKATIEILDGVLLRDTPLTITGQQNNQIKNSQVISSPIKVVRSNLKVSNSTIVSNDTNGFQSEDSQIEINNCTFHVK